MQFRLDQLQQSIGGKGVRRIALGCNILLAGWIAWTLTQAVTGLRETNSGPQPADATDRKPAQSGETRRPEQYNIAGWHLFGEPSLQSAQPEPEKTNAPETRLNLELNGIYLGDQAADSRAIIAEKGKTQAHFRSGDQLPGNAVLDEIHADHVLLLRNGRYERLALPENPGGDAGMGFVVSSTSPVQAARRAAILARPRAAAQSLPTLLNLRPVVRDGQFRGMAIRAGSSEGQRLLDNTNVKLEPGDVVIAINGMEIRSAEAGMAMLEDYTEPERLELTIMRDDDIIPVIIAPEQVSDAQTTGTGSDSQD